MFVLTRFADLLSVAMSGATSLLDVAKEMQKTEEKVGAASGALTLADVARDQDKTKDPAGMTLMDVARQ